MSRKTILILAALTVIILGAVAALLPLPSSSGGAPQRPLLDKGEGLPDGEIVAARTWAGKLGVHKGDVFSYMVEIWYDPAGVAEIDTASLDREINLHPFEVTDIKESSFGLGPRTRVYQRAYEIQLLTDKADRLYTFPTALIRYRLKGSGGLSTTSITPEPVYVSPRVPPDVPELQFGYGPLRPIAGKVDGAGGRLPWVLWAVGGCLVVLGAADLARQALSGWNHSKAQRCGPGEGELVGEAYRSLCRNCASGADPKLLLHQMDRILRIVLAQKEGAGWLEELTADRASAGVREPVAALLDACAKAYGRDPVEPGDVQAARQQLDRILTFYFGQSKVDAWRS